MLPLQLFLVVVSFLLRPGSCGLAVAVAVVVHGWARRSSLYGKEIFCVSEGMTGAWDVKELLLLT